MNHQIIVDSCVDFNDELLGQKDKILRVPFKIMLDGEEMTDKDLDTSSLVSKMKADIGKISTACPSPSDFYSAFKKNTVNFVVTISSKVSGSYQSAMIAKNMLKEEDQVNAVHVIDSKSASAGQSLIVLKLKNLLEKSSDSEQIIQKINEYIGNLKTLFLPASLDNLVKNGRISGFKAMIGKALRVVPILGSNENGEIVLKGRAMGEKQAVERLLAIIALSAVDIKNSMLAITYVDDREKAERIKETIQNRLRFKEIHIFRAGGLSSVYVDRGGLVFAF